MRPLVSDRLYKNYLLVLLLLILACNYVDRFALGLLLQEVKLDLRLSDTQLGLLNGMAFAFFYALMGIPIARWADRGNRVAIISITTALWSTAVVLCGLAGSFLQLLVLRIAVAVGEAGCIPPANSLLPEYFSRAERPRAVSIYMLGASLSVLMGYFGGGWLDERYGWRTTFMLLGAPGFAFAVIAWLTLKEPRRSREWAPEPDFKEICVTLWSNATFRHLLSCFAVIQFFGSGIQQWQPTFFVRSYGLTTGDLGVWLAVMYGIGGMLGLYLGGALASERAANNERLQMRAMAIVYCCFAVISALIYITASRYVALVLTGLSAAVAAAVTGPLLATVQTLVPARTRAMSIAIIYLFSNLIGLGLGPLAAGALSDVLQPLFRQDSLRYALLVLSPGYFWAGWHLWRGSRTVTRDLATVET